MKNIVQRGGTYHFRKVIPPDLRKVFRKTAITLSLRTTSKQLAQVKAVTLLGTINAAIYEMRCYEATNQREAVLKVLEEALSIHTAKDSPLLQPTNIIRPGGIPEATPEPNIEEPGITLKEAYRLFEAEKVKTEWGIKSRSCYLTSFRILLDIMGNLHVNQINKEVALSFAQSLYEYPRNRHLGAGKTMTWKEMRDNGAPSISPVTVKIHFTRNKAFFGWLESYDYISENYLKKLTPKGKKTRPIGRDSFTPEEIQKLFQQAVLPEKTAEKCWRFWMTVLLLYTGARRDEIVQLDVDDIKFNSDFYYIDIHDRGDHQLKTEYSARVIPLHQDIIKIDFLKYFESRKGNKKLFDVNPTLGAFGRPLTNWFTGIKRELGFADTKVLHSLRHTFRDFAVESRVPNEHLKALLGHSQGDMTHGIYGSGFSLKLLNESMQQIDFSCVRDILI
ncbi:site-specific integrase [Endozoicomonas sp. SM1973]|uniref:Site-specific integrase n=1 Tax=Spartinivicinus marinus TaxID=2994442 RepID=A0A853I0V9_9GAMM|nr:site-specific integrase [Spartinivicinus marinus]MCX4024721.1 site-specific integrase [Spartinivicinus marinus]NYZ66249.1 site-specific integrase [Spartinivicinus marinus]